jgi:hypothetical protein
MQNVVPIALFCLLLAGCGAGGGSGTVQETPDGKALIETEIAPDGAKVVEFTIRSGATGALPAGLLPPDAAAEYARIASEVRPGDIGYYRYVGPPGAAAAQPLPDVAGVPQTLTSQTTGTQTTTTYTYGTPPTAAVPASGPVRAPICNLQMTGGTGYTCAVR